MNQNILFSFQLMGKGMLSIFIVVIAIYIIVNLLLKYSKNI